MDLSSCISELVMLYEKDVKIKEGPVEDDKIALSLTKPYIFYEDVPDAMGRPRQLQTTKLRYKDTAGRSCVLGMPK